MTSVERRVRDAMHEESLTPGAGWTAVVQRAEARRRRRRLAERTSFVGLLAAICALTLLATVGVPGASSPAAGEGGTGLGWGADRVISLAGLSAIGLFTVGRCAWWPRRRRPPAPAQVRGWAAGRVAAAALALGSLAWPLWVYSSHLCAIDDRVDELSAFAGIEVTGVDRHRSPLVGRSEPIATVTVEVVGAAGETRVDQLERSRWVDVRRGVDGRATVDLLRGWSPDPSVLPAVLLVDTYGLALAAVLVRRHEVGRRLARLVGLLTLAQAGLLAFALWRAADALATYRAAVGLETFGVEEYHRPGFFSRAEGQTLYDRIHDVAGPLYPMGGWSAALLLAPWAVAISVGRRDGDERGLGRLQVVLAALALAGAVAAASFPHNEVVLWILD